MASVSLAVYRISPNRKALTRMEKYRVILLMAVLAVLIVYCQCDPEPKHRVIRAVTSTVKPTTKKTTAKATTKKATTKKAATTTVGPIRLAVFGAVEETDEETTSAQQVLATTKKTTIATGRPRKTTVRYIDNDGLTYVRSF